MSLCALSSLATRLRVAQLFPLDEPFVHEFTRFQPACFLFGNGPLHLNPPLQLFSHGSRPSSHSNWDWPTKPILFAWLNTHFHEFRGPRRAKKIVDSTRTWLFQPLSSRLSCIGFIVVKEGIPDFPPPACSDCAALRVPWRESQPLAFLQTISGCTRCRFCFSRLKRCCT